MKIGEFAGKYDISIDAVRHYIDMGLLFPVKSRSGYYQFDEDCHRNIKRIMQLKQMKFSLDEIKRILSYEALAGQEIYKENNSYRDMFEKKKQQIENDIGDLIKAKDMVDEASRTGDSKYDSSGNLYSHTFGINIKDISILSCPKCTGEFSLTKADISHDKLISAELSCSCGFKMRITDGIIIADEKLLVSGEAALDIGSYIDNTDPQFIGNIQRSISWFKNEIDFESFNNKIIIELGSGSGFFLRSLYENLPDDCLYIAVDNNINRHFELQKMLEKYSITKNIIFACCDFDEIPFKKRSARVILDFSGSTNYAFSNEEFLISKEEDMFSRDAVLFGSYFIFENFKANGLIEDRYRKHFMKKNILANLKQAGFHLIKSYESEQLAQGRIYENFFVEGERVRSFLYHGKRI